MKTIPHRCSTLGADLLAEEETDTGHAEFRGIPYASVSKRWTQSRVQDSLPSPFDATKFGPKCPQPPHSSTIAMGVKDPIVEADEFNCLNLNVSVPLEALPARGQNEGSYLLPVMVWVHGGHFRTGSNSSARYNPQVLSSLAKKAGHPIVLVQINYRLGVLGFGASSDLAAEHESIASQDLQPHQNPEYFGNFGLVDQLNAFQWVQNHIQDFGGDPANVTAFGVSAGSASLHMHILSGNPLFDRAILMSGSAPTLGPVPLEYLDAAWNKLCKSTGVSNETREKRLENLRALSLTELAEKMPPNLMLFPFADGKLLQRSWRLGDPHPKSRYAMLFLQYFGFSPSEDQPHEAYRDAMRFFLSVVLFHFPNLRIAETYAGNAHLYHFEEPSPYEGPSHGLPVHGQCAIFVYNNEKSLWPESAQNVSLEMANIWTSFAYGKTPWETYSTAERFMRFGPGGECTLRNFENDNTRNYEYLGWLREHFEETKSLMESLMG